jgi:competence protein ComFB
MEFAVREHCERMLESRKDLCACEQCVLDVMALVLNRLPARYIVTDKGRIMTKIKEAEVQFQADILREIVRALQIVTERPRHKK